MTHDQIVLLTLLAGGIFFFLWGKWRFDLTALLTLICGTLLGIVPMDKAFSGFGHPAIFMVISVLIMSHALIEVGITDSISNLLNPLTRFLPLHIFILCIVAAFLSAFINNIGALALLMPVALKTGLYRDRSPGLLLMPLSFGSILGGLITSIGTPPNIIISKYRATILGEPFEMFDFSPIGLLVAGSGILFIALVGWRLIPESKRKKKASEALFEVENYVIQAKVPKGWTLEESTIRDLESQMESLGTAIVGLSRGSHFYKSLPQQLPLKAGDILILEGEPKDLSRSLEKLHLEGLNTEGKKIDLFQEGSFVEVVLSQYSTLVGKEAGRVRLRRRYDVSLLGISRQGKAHRSHLKRFKFGVGDILLLQGDEEAIKDFIQAFNCWPLAERNIRFQHSKKTWRALGIFMGAIFLSLFKVVPLHMALPLGAALMALSKTIPIQKMYDGVDWPVVILLGCMIPLGEALESTGTASYLVSQFFKSFGGMDAYWTIALLMAVTMTVSDVLNNAATAVLMAPIAYHMATSLGGNPDPFLMAVTIGASSSFLTPIGHQNNALIMGPGGYGFRDYWRMGLPLEILIVLVATPAILYFWPL